MCEQKTDTIMNERADGWIDNEWMGDRWMDSWLNGWVERKDDNTKVLLLSDTRNPTLLLLGSSETLPSLPS